ncbi:MAG: DUF1571 domain-containing protein [Bacteroidetes bacterium]|nr:DUF1571 domain-containing protein [Bacteroidota bacterium]
MKAFRILVIILFTGFFFGSTTQKSTLSCGEIIQHMLDTIRNIRTQTCDVKATERVGKHLLFAESSIKINYLPKKIYFRSSKGIEVLWIEGTNKGNALVHSRSIPLINFDLDPYGSVMRKDQHHTIFDLGCAYIGITIANTIVKAPKDFDKHFAYAGILNWNNRDCYQIVMSYPEYKYVEYITKKGETVTSIAQKLNTSDFKIRSKNDLSSYFGSIKEGKKLTIPIPYSNKALLLIDKKTFVPLNIKVYDEEGLYEAYEFYNMKTNIVFKSDEFLKSYKDYGF